VVGLTFATSKAHLIRAALECIPYQIRAVVDAVAGETGIRCLSIRADGGISANEFVMQWLADTLGLPVHTLTFPDVTALGAALAAGVGAGIYGGIDEVTSLDLAERIRRPAPSGSGPSRAASGYLSWRRQVDRLVDTLVDT
jgi:glycerol kinase